MQLDHDATASFKVNRSNRLAPYAPRVLVRVNLEGLPTSLVESHGSARGHEDQQVFRDIPTKQCKEARGAGGGNDTEVGNGTGE